KLLVNSPVRTKIRKKLLNAQQRKFVKQLIKTGEVANSAMAAGYDPTYGSHLLKKPEVAAVVLQGLEEAGLTDSYLFKKLKEGCEAVYPKKYSARGKLVQDNEPDYFTRAIYLDKSFKLKNYYAPERHEIEQRKVVFHVTPDLIKGLIDSGVVDLKEVRELVEKDGIYQEQKPQKLDEKEGEISSEVALKNGENKNG
ncbi:MAG: hypothetical protein NC828_01625, partial [Candidatus Omnitrophica bacterium]|nr:hypothetical protein [Candidatus Omnitrophota bacterium]